MCDIIKILKKKNKAILFLYLISTILGIVSFSVLVSNLTALKGIETFFRYLLIFIILIIFMFIFLKNLSSIIKKKYYLSSVLSVSVIIFSILLFASSSIISIIYGSLSSFMEKSDVNYTSLLVSRSDSKFDDDATIGMITHKDDVEGYILAHTLILNEDLSNDIEYYDNYIKMLNDLEAGVIDAAFVSGNYLVLYSDDTNFADLSSDTRVLYEYSEVRENADVVASSNKDFDEPLTFLILGVDSEGDGLDANAAFNGDTLMMVTFNPDTLNATMFSIPRDTLVPIACNNNEIFKINASAAGGTKCVIDTVENLTNIDIDYYVKINFKGVVDLVDALGGITVDVEAPTIDLYDGRICEQDSDRKFGENLICFDSGVQTLDGEEALAYARNRKLYLSSDIDRIRHQQDIVTAIANKATTLKSLDDFSSILDAVSRNIATNMDENTMLSAYEVFKSMILNVSSGDDIITIEKSYLKYYDLRMYSPSYNMEVAAISYYKDSLDDIIKMMNVNLGKEDITIEKSFSFTYDEDYTSYVYGKDYSSVKTYELLSSLIGKSKEDATSYCDNNNLECTFTYVDNLSSKYNFNIGVNLIGNQSISANSILVSGSKLTLYINDSVVQESVLSANEDEDDVSDEVVVEDSE